VIILSAGLHKSGSAWYFNLTNDLLVAAGHQDVRAIRKRFHLHSILRYQNCVVDEPTLFRLALIAIPHFLGNTFAVKTHSRPSVVIRCLMSLGIMKATYIYRDPRDAAISAYEFGQIIRKRGETHSFANLHSVEEAIRYIKKQLAKWDKWVRCNHVLTIRFEDLLADTVTELKRLAAFLSLNVPGVDLQKIATSYQADQLAPKKTKALHFNIGIPGRFTQVMSREDLELCKKYFGSYLRKMGYPD